MASSKRLRSNASPVSSASAAPIVTTSSGARDEGPEVVAAWSPQTDKQALLDQAVLQLLSAYGCLPSGRLDEMVATISSELQVTNCNLPAVFRRLNVKLRPLSFEIKTVVLRSSTGEESRYHGLANVEEDAIAKEHGNSFSSAEMAFFQDIALRLLLEGMLSTDDVLNLKPEKIPEAQVHSFIRRLIDQQYLTRNDRDFLILAPRANLELSQFLEAVLLQSNKYNDIANPEERRQRLLELLPQLLIY